MSQEGPPRKKHEEGSVVGRLIINLGRERRGEGSGVPPSSVSPTDLSCYPFPQRDVDYRADYLPS